MEKTSDDHVVLRTRFLLCPALWCWEIVDADHGAVIASSWNNEWLAYDSPEAALAAAPTSVRKRGRELPITVARAPELRKTA